MVVMTSWNSSCNRRNPSATLTIGLFMPDDVAMATKTLIVDDLDGSDDASTVSFSLGNMAYEIDLSKKNKAAMEKKLAKFTAAARKVGSSARRRGSRSANRQQTGAIREWAKASGRKVSERGRIPQSVIDAYNAVHN